jgi:hypothetical protein
VGLLIWDAHSDERTGLSFTVYNAKCIYISHVINNLKISGKTATVILGSGPGAIAKTVHAGAWGSAF